MKEKYVSRTLLYRVLAGASPGAIGAVRFVYLPDEPYAVQFCWYGRDCWMVDRETFAEGIHRDSGDGAVRFSRCVDCDGVHITFIKYAEGVRYANVLLFNPGDLVRALEATERIVPRGQEPLDIDRELAVLLDGAS
ncbi:hypothetical protein BAY59_10940 [Prauserella coralliicola]|nr:hypothetical protein BAY59_10940 [Prauserella coralliicola]